MKQQHLNQHRAMPIGVGRARLMLVLVTALLAAPTVAAEELDIGDRAPGFELQGSDGKVHRLADYRGTAVVLAWFPKAFTGG